MIHLLNLHCLQDKVIDAADNAQQDKGGAGAGADQTQPQAGASSLEGASSPQKQQRQQQLHQSNPYRNLGTFTRAI